MSGRVYVIPGDHDVLCGRGRVFFEHVGNMKFRGIIEKALPGYAKAETKGEKTCFVRRVVNEIFDEGGRFLKLDRSANRWYEGDIVCAKSKVGHAFRDAISEQQGHAPSSSSDSEEGHNSHGKVEEPGSDSQDSEVSLGASSLLLLGKAAVAAKSSKTNGRGITKQAIAEPSETHQPQSSIENSLLPTRPSSSRDIDNEPAVISCDSRAGSPKKEAKSSRGTSQSDRLKDQQRASSLATVKQAMLKTLVLRQQALSRSNSFRKPAEADLPPSSANVEISSPQSSSSSRVSETLECSDHQSSISTTQMTGDARTSLDKRLDSNNHKSQTSRSPLPPSTSESKHPNQSNLTRQAWLIPNNQHRIPGMLNAAELKKAMLTTLAARQEALGKHGNLQSFSAGDGRLQVNDLFQKAKNTRPLSASEILQQAIEAQNNAMSRPIVKTQAGDASISERKAEKRPPKKHPLKEADAAPSCRKSIEKQIGATQHGDEEERFGIKRRRHSPQPPAPSSMSKKHKPLSELAEENSLQFQARLGPCYPCGTEVNSLPHYYFL